MEIECDRMVEPAGCMNFWSECLQCSTQEVVEDRIPEVHGGLFPGIRESFYTKPQCRHIVGNNNLQCGNSSSLSMVLQIIAKKLFMSLRDKEMETDRYRERRRKEKRGKCKERWRKNMVGLTFKLVLNHNYFSRGLINWSSNNVWNILRGVKKLFHFIVSITNYFIL